MNAFNDPVHPPTPPLIWWRVSSRIDDCLQPCRHTINQPIQISSVMWCRQVFSIYIFNASTSDARPKISPNSISISLHTDSMGFKSGDCAGHSRMCWPLQNLYPIQLPVAIRMPIVSRSIVFLNNCPSVLLATSMPKRDQCRLQGSSYIGYEVDLRFAGECR